MRGFWSNATSVVGSIKPNTYVSLSTSELSWYCESYFKPSSHFLSDHPKEVLLMCIGLILCLSLPYCLVCVIQPCGHLKGSFHGSTACDVFLCFCYFPIWYPRSGVVLDCIYSWSWHCFLLWLMP